MGGTEMGGLFLLFGSLLVAGIAAEGLLSKYKVPFVSGTIACISMGIFVGSCIIASQNDEVVNGMVSFKPWLFVNILLPIIIFEAGYSMKKSYVFADLALILGYAILGTLISSILVYAIVQSATRLTGAESFAFGALISATDPVATIAVFKQVHGARRVSSLPPLPLTPPRSSASILA